MSDEIALPYGEHVLIRRIDWRAFGAVSVLLLSALGQLADALLGRHLVGLPLMLLVSAAAAYAVGTWATPSVAAGAIVGAAAALTWATQVASPGEFPVLDDLVFFLLVIGAPALAGAILRSRTRQVRELRRLRALLATQREREIRVARMAEQNRIEVDLHRGFSEQIVGIILRGEGAQDAPDDELRSALSDIEGSARSTLDRLRTSLGTLNDAQTPPAVQAPTEPTAPSELPPGWRDVAIAAACALAVAVEGVVSPEAQGPAWANVALAALAASPLAWRRSRPVAASTAMFVALVIMGRWCTPPSTMVTTIAPLLITAYAVGAHTRGWRRVVGFAVVAAGLTATVFASPPSARESGDFLPILIWSALAGALGIVNAGWAARAARLRETVDALESGREIEVQLAMAEQRCAVARDLHDSVAHAMTVVCLQAAAGSIAGDHSALGTIVSTARRGLDELRMGLGSLGDGDSLDPSSLAAQARHVGLDSDVRVIGDPTSMSASSLQLAARILREAIVNAGRYAPGSHLTVSIDAHLPLVHLEVVDNGCAVTSTWTDGAGTGLAGLADDLARAGGSLEWGPNPTGGFRVSAEVPA